MITGLPYSITPYNQFFGIYNQPGATLGAPPGTVTPAAPAGYSPTAGGVPQVPDPLVTAQQAVQGNVNALPGLERLGSQVNPFQQQQLLGQYAASIPNYAGLTAQNSGLIGNQLGGQIPPDVMNLIAQTGAERGIASGFPGAPNANAAMLRALGLTSLDLQRQGQQNLLATQAGAPVAAPFDISRFMTSPQDVYSAQQLANLYASAPSPAAKEAANRAAFAAGARAGYSGGYGGGSYAPQLPQSTRDMSFTTAPKGPSWGSDIQQWNELRGHEADQGNMTFDEWVRDLYGPLDEVPPESLYDQNAYSDYEGNAYSEYPYE